MKHLVSLFHLLALIAVPVLSTLAARMAYRRFPRRFEVVVSVFLVSLMGFLTLFLFGGASLPRPPSLVEDVRGGRVAAQEIRSIEFSRPVPGALVGGVERLHVEPDRTGACFEEFYNHLAQGTLRGSETRNHPVVISVEHSLKITLLDGSSYLLAFTVYRDRNGEYDYVTFTSWPKEAEREGLDRFLAELLGPGPVQSHYESRGLVEFVRKHDPWFGK